MRSKKSGDSSRGAPKKKSQNKDSAAPSDPITDLFGEAIFVYSRQNALDDGVLIDEPLDRLAKEYGFKVHCAMTSGLYCSIFPDEMDHEPSIIDGRIWDMLTILRFELSKSGKSASECRFHFLVQKAGSSDLRKVHVKTVIGPGDQGEPVLTFMLPDED